jgi:hypothetical protein
MFLFFKFVLELSPSLARSLAVRETEILMMFVRPNDCEPMIMITNQPTATNDAKIELNS